MTSCPLDLYPSTRYGNLRIMNSVSRAIIHADFDAFYASVEQRDRPELKGKALLVGGKSEDRGVVASASYEARAFGIRSAMPMGQAMRLCPHAIRIAPRFEAYKEISLQALHIFGEVTPLVEPISLDEAYLDVTEVHDDLGGPARLGLCIKERIKEELGLSISVGVASSKSVAKIASDIDKPNGFVVVRPGTESKFLSPLLVEVLWGVGPKTAQRLHDEGVHTIGELSNRTATWHEKIFGSNSNFMKNLSKGVDGRKVIVGRKRKSLSLESTLRESTSDPTIVRELVIRLSQKLGRSLVNRGLSGRVVRIKLRMGDFVTFTRQESQDHPIQYAADISEVALRLTLREMLPGRVFRLVGVGMTGFDYGSEGTVQGRLEGL